MKEEYQKLSEELLNDPEFQDAIKGLQQAMELLNKENGTSFGVDVSQREDGGIAIRLG